MGWRMIGWSDTGSWLSACMQGKTHCTSAVVHGTVDSQLQYKHHNGKQYTTQSLGYIPKENPPTSDPPTTTEDNSRLLKRLVKSNSLLVTSVKKFQCCNLAGQASSIALHSYYSANLPLPCTKINCLLWLHSILFATV